MAFDFNFRTIQSTKDLKQLVDFLMKQDLGHTKKYPEYEKWVVQRVIPEIDSGYKKVILVFSYGHLVGDLIYQAHKQFQKFIELKNGRIDPAVRGRFCFNFMLRQVEYENSKGFDAIMCDVREGSIAEINMLENAGYIQLKKLNLYDSHIQDIILIKYLNQNGLLLKI